MKTLLEIEKERELLAINNRLTKFRNTYLNTTDIENINTKKFWNCKLKLDKEILAESPIFRDKIKIVSGYLKDKKGKILDIGFGQGYLEKVLAKHKDISIYGIDISNTAIKYAKNNLKGEYKFANIFNIPYKSSFFDYVVVLDVLEHISSKNILSAYNEILRVLKKNGVLVISIPLNEGLEKMLTVGFNPNGHMRIYQPIILKTELKLFNVKIFREYLLYAFRSLYRIKSLTMKILPFRLRKPNLAIFFARK